MKIQFDMTSATTTSEAQVSYFMISTDKCGLAADLATGCTTIPCLLSSTENFKANSMNELPLVKFIQLRQAQELL